jgi:hypothetical protein
MTKRTDDGFSGRLITGLASAIVDKNYEDAKELVAILAKEHGVGAIVERVIALNPER